MEIKHITLSGASVGEMSVTRPASGVFEKTLTFIKTIPHRLIKLFKKAVGILLFPFRFIHENIILKLLKRKSASHASDWVKNKHVDATSTKSRRKIKFPKKFFLKALVVVIAIAVLSVAYRLVKNSFSNLGSKESQDSVAGAQAEQKLNKEFTFPLQDSAGEEVSRIKYTIEKAELRDSIIIQGQRATAISGRTFLILNLKVTNSHKQGIEINTRDYVRLIAGGNKEELLAPSMHNDPVEVQAISTKYSRLGFPIDTDERDLVLLVGEIDGEKEEVRLEF